jgi:hypothetical protein
LFIANCFLQFLLLNAFLGEKHNFWGYQVFNSLRSGQDWQHTGHFPRVTLCDFQVYGYRLTDVPLMGNILVVGAQSRQCAQLDSAMCAHAEYVERKDLSISVVVADYCHFSYNHQHNLLDLCDDGAIC